MVSLRRLSGGNTPAIAHLGTGAFLTAASNIVLPGPPGTGKIHLATAVGWVARLQAAHQNGQLPQELVRLRRYGLIIVDEVGYIPFEQDAANLFLQLVSSRYEHASLILTSNLPFDSLPSTRPENTAE